MSLHFYTEKEDYLKEESVDYYKDLFIQYYTETPTLSDALKQIFINSGANEELSNDLIKDIISKTEQIINKNWNQISNKYSKITKEDSKIISSYTCESKDKKYSPYRILNKNLVSDNRKEGLKYISKYLFILLKSLRKLDKYYPNDKNKYLYRCINTKVNLNYDLFNKKIIPYIIGNTKTFWGFTSSSPDVQMTYDFLKGEENNKSGTIFTLTGKVWGYDITLFNYYNEKEILLEPERKYKIDEIIPPVNDIIHIRCDIKDTSIILNDNIFKMKCSSNSQIHFPSGNPLNFDYLLKFTLIGDADTGKSNIIMRFYHGQFKPESQLTIGCEFGAKNIEINNKIYRIQIWDTAGQENFRSITRAYYKNSTCAIFVYNITNRDSFDNIPDWIEDCKKQSPKTITMILVGNFAELDDKRVVSYDEGQSLADKYGIKFYEVSFITGQNIDELFYNTTYDIAKKIENGYYDLNDENCGIRPYRIYDKIQGLSFKKDKKQSNCLII